MHLKQDLKGDLQCSNRMSHFYRWLSILILLTYMGVVIVILLNVLIAQLSYTYSEAKKIAKLQYAADVIRNVTRLEYSRFKCLVGIVLAHIKHFSTEKLFYI